MRPCACKGKRGLARLAEALKRLVAPSQPLLAVRETDALARANALYTPSLAARVNAWARIDRTLFGYAPWMLGQQVRVLKRAT